jgi:DNA mismatch repair ATPase MutS
MLTTHFIKLCKLFRKNKRTKNCSMQASVEGDSPTYTYKVVKGMSNIKGGVCVLRQLGYPDKMIKTTHRIIDSL